MPPLASSWPAAHSRCRRSKIRIHTLSSLLVASSLLLAALLLLSSPLSLSSPFLSVSAQTDGLGQPTPDATTTGGSDGGLYGDGNYNPLAGQSDSTGSAGGDTVKFGENLPDYPPFNITYTPDQCQFVDKWSGPRCPAGYECVSTQLSRHSRDDDSSASPVTLSYRQEQCVFCAATSFCTKDQIDACKQLDVLTDDLTLRTVNETAGVGDCRVCREGQYCPAGISNPFGLAVVNLCTAGSTCPTPDQQIVCPEGFFCPPGTKFPLGCTITGTYCGEGSTDPSELCPGGSYCPDPKTRITCPSGYFCKAGSIAPKKCQGLASCPRGSAAALIIWQGLLLVLLIYAAMAAVYYFVLWFQHRRRKQDKIKAARLAEGEEVVQLIRNIRQFQQHEKQGRTPHSMATAANTGGHAHDSSANPHTQYLLTKTHDDANYVVVKRSLDHVEKAPEVVAMVANTKPDTTQEKQVEETLPVVVKQGDKVPEDKAEGAKQHAEGTEAEKDEAGKEKSIAADSSTAAAAARPDLSPVKESAESSTSSSSSSSSSSQEKDRTAQHEQVSIILPTDWANKDVTPPHKKEPEAHLVPVSKQVMTEQDVPSASPAAGAVVAGEDDGSSSGSDSEDEEDRPNGFEPIPIPINIRFEKLGLKIKNGKEEKQVLKGVSGSFKHSTLTACMGPSGCGKSTFLNVLCGKATYGVQSGKVFLNDVETQVSSVKSVMGFVPQDDVLHSDLTCYENLHYQAMLRLPKSMKHAQKMRIVDDTIRMLGLEAIKHSVVGSVEKRGISGGQRKRVSIGMEICSWPTLLFMDEPTSGLDSSASFEVLSALRSLTRMGVSIVTVIHQPRFSIVELFDQMLLLGKDGQTVFLGSSQQALKYFEQLGFRLPLNENPTDFFLDVISGEVRREGDPDFQPPDLFELWETEGEWVRNGEEGPPGWEDDAESDPAEEGSSPAVDSLLPQETPVILVTPPPYRNQPTTRNAQSTNNGGNWSQAASPIDSTTNAQGGQSGFQRSHTMQGELKLPAAGYQRRCRSSAEEDLQQGYASARGSNQYPYFYPSGRPTHLSTQTPQSQSHSQSDSQAYRSTRARHRPQLSVYTQGVLHSTDLPLPKHREMLNRLGKDGVGKLVQDYRDSKHHKAHQRNNSMGAVRARSPAATPHTQHESRSPAPIGARLPSEALRKDLDRINFMFQHPAHPRHMPASTRARPAAVDRLAQFRRAAAAVTQRAAGDRGLSMRAAVDAILAEQRLQAGHMAASASPNSEEWEVDTSEQTPLSPKHAYDAALPASAPNSTRSTRHAHTQSHAALGNIAEDEEQPDSATSKQSHPNSATNTVGKVTFHHQLDDDETDPSKLRPSTSPPPIPPPILIAVHANPDYRSPQHAPLAVKKLHDSLSPDSRNQLEVEMSQLDSTKQKPAVADDTSQAVSLSGTIPPPRQTPWVPMQFLHLLQRHSLKLLRGIHEVVFDMTLTTAVGLSIGLIYGGVWSLSGYATISVMAVLSIGVLACVSALKMFGHDRIVFWRESSAGVSITAYWLAVTLLHLPLTLLFSFLFVAPYYNLILPDSSFLSVWWVFIAIHFACSGGGMLLSVVFEPTSALLSGVMIPLIMGGFLNGVSPPLSEMGEFMKGLCDISYSRYGVEALMLGQLLVQPNYADNLVYEISGKIGFALDHLQFDIGILFTIGIVLRLLTLIALLTLNKSKRV